VNATVTPVIPRSATTRISLFELQTNPAMMSLKIGVLVDVLLHIDLSDSVRRYIWWLDSENSDFLDLSGEPPTF
jgi:hypothetical protein